MQVVTDDLASFAELADWRQTYLWTSLRAPFTDDVVVDLSRDFMTRTDQPKAANKATLVGVTSVAEASVPFPQPATSARPALLTDSDDASAHEPPHPDRADRAQLQYDHGDRAA